MTSEDRTNAQIEGFEVEDFTPAEIAQAEREADAALDDMGRFVLERGPEGSETVLIDEADGALRLLRSVDVEPTLDWCKGHYSQAVVDRHCEFRQLASLPPSVLDLWARAKNYGLPDQWWQMKRYHHLVIDAAHDSELSGFRLMGGEYRRGGEG
jgi:hypothetical protein